jgi:hypothetical protein
MNEKARTRWQRRSGALLEDGEQIEAVSVGYASEGMWSSAMLGGALLMAIEQRGRAYIVTDRNVYVGRTSAWKGSTITEIVAKRPRHFATVELRNRRLWLDGGNPVFIGAALRKRARELATTVTPGGAAGVAGADVAGVDVGAAAL